MTTMNAVRVALLGLVAAAVVSAACAARAPLAAVPPAIPEVSAVADAVAEPPPSVPPPESLKIRPVTTSTLESVETWDAGLGEALTTLAIAPSAGQHLRVAAEYKRLRIFDKALEHLTTASTVEATRGAALDELARLWRDAGHPSVGIGHAHRAVAHAPGAATYNTLGTILTALGWRDAARDAFSRAVSLDPKAAYAWSNLCYTHFLDVAFDRAVEACTTALTLDPALAAARNNLALAHAGAGRLDRAADEFGRAGDVADGRYNMGLVYLALRQFERAAEEFDAALKLRPSFDGAGLRARQARALADRRR
jgi:tetratricopeptide (TPR) repeat protein